jgi:hypothetical protein
MLDDLYRLKTQNYRMYQNLLLTRSKELMLTRKEDEKQEVLIDDFENSNYALHGNV